MAIVSSETYTASITSLDGIVTGDLYSFEVVASNAIGDSVASERLVDVVAGSLPSQPFNFKRATSVTPVDTKISV